MSIQLPLDKKKRYMSCLFAAVAVLFLIMTAGCGEKGPDPNEILWGSWRFQDRNAHTIITFKANGTWSSGTRIEGKHSQIVEKRGKASGDWRIEEQALVLDVFESDFEEGWKAGENLSYGIIDLTPEKMTLQISPHRTREWTKVRAKKQQAEAGVPMDRVLSVKPVVVNLDKAREHSKNRYLCVDLGVILLPDETMSPEENIVQPIHPKIRELIVLYLSSQAYNDVNTFDKVKEVRKRLEKILSTYFNDELKEVKINNIVVASSQDSLNEFIAQYPELGDAELVLPDTAPSEEPENG